MTLKEMLLEYVEGRQAAIPLIRALSGMFQPEQAIDRLVIICQIARMEQGDLSKEDFRKLYLKDVKKEKKSEPKKRKTNKKASKLQPKSAKRVPDSTSGEQSGPDSNQ